MRHRPRRRLGQHFLHDPGIISRIVDAIDPRPGQRVVEIGPGLGAITVPLLRMARRLEVVELDRDLAAALRERCAQEGELTVYEADALRFDFCSVLKPDTRLRLVGNLPYNISTPLLFHLFSQRDCIADMHFMLQKEVVQRMVARPGGKTYGRLTVMVAIHAAVQALFTIAPGAFTPPPKVESTFIRLTLKPLPDVDLAIFAEIVAQAFSMRRKTLRNALKRLLTAEDIVAVGLSPSMRPENVEPSGYIELARHLARKPRA